MTLFLSKTVAQSRAAGLAALAGASTGLVIHSVLVAAGLSVLLAASVDRLHGPEDRRRALPRLSRRRRAPPRLVAVARQEAAREPIRSVYLKGLLIDLLNPKVIIFFVTFLPQFVSPDDPHAAKKMLFLGLTFAVVNIPVCVPLILSADRIAGC